MKETNYLDGNAEYLERLKTIPGLAALKDKNLLRMISLSRLRRYAPGEKIIEEGLFDSWIFFLLSGSVRITKEGQELARMKCYGDLFGEMGLVDGLHRSATVVAETEALCLAMDGSFLDRIDSCERSDFNAVLYRFLTMVLTERLRSMDDEIASLKARLRKAEEK